VVSKSAPSHQGKVRHVQLHQDFACPACARRVVRPPTMGQTQRRRRLVGHPDGQGRAFDNFLAVVWEEWGPPSRAPTAESHLVRWEVCRQVNLEHVHAAVIRTRRRPRSAAAPGVAERQTPAYDFAITRTVRSAVVLSPNQGRQADLWSASQATHTSRQLAQMLAAAGRALHLYRGLGLLRPQRP
jgi:hypothetical protein